MARGWRGAGMLTGIGRGLDQAGDAFLQVALARRGFDLREKQLGQQQKQFQQTQGVRERMAKAYELRNLLGIVGRDDFFNDLNDYLNMEAAAPPIADMRSMAQGMRERELFPDEASMEPRAPVMARRGAGTLGY